MGMGNSKPKKQADQTNNTDFNDALYQPNNPFSWIDFPWGQIGTNDASNSHAAKFRTWFQDSDLKKGGQYWAQTTLSPEECWNRWGNVEKANAITKFFNPKTSSYPYSNNCVTWPHHSWDRIGTSGDLSDSNAAQFRAWFQNDNLNKGGQYWSENHMSPKECWNSWDKAERFKSIKQFLISSLQESASDDANKPVQQSPRQRF